MRGAARAIGWEFRWRHRLWLIALGVYVIVFFAITRLIPGPGRPIRLNPPNGLAGFIIAPVSLTFFYFVGVFSYGLAGDLAARESIFPARMFTLPVTTGALAGWPMLYGTAAAAGLWMATALLARWPGGVDVYVPWVWPALLMAAYLAWTQALMWMPYGLPGVRVVIAALWLMAVDVIVLLALHYQAREAVMVAICAPQIPLAYLVARAAVARARRGEVPDWSGLFAWLGRIADVLPRRGDRVLSPSRAQTWFEWRRHGRTLPALVAMVVPVELLLLFLPGNDTAPIVFEILFMALITPPFMAAFAAAALSTSTPYITTRPLTSASLVAAKLKMTAWSTLAAWLLVIVFIAGALLLSGRMAVVVERARAGADGIVRSQAVQSAIWNGLPWLLAALVFLKMIAGAWVAIRLYDSRLLSDRALVAGAACWLATVLALYGVLEWFAASPLIPRYFLGAIAILQVPLARVSAAPLALASSRHR